MAYVVKLRGARSERLEISLTAREANETLIFDNAQHDATLRWFDAAHQEGVGGTFGLDEDSDRNSIEWEAPFAGSTDTTDILRLVQGIARMSKGQRYWIWGGHAAAEYVVEGW